jgi:hypothetical protein
LRLPLLLAIVIAATKFKEVVVVVDKIVTMNVCSDRKHHMTDRLS